MSRPKSPPKYETLKAFMGAHARGEIPKDARLRYQTMNSAVIIETRSGRVLYRCEHETEFLMVFAAALDMEGIIA